MKNFAIILMIFLSIGQSYALTNIVKVGLYQWENPHHIIVSPTYGSYKLIADRQELGEIKPGTSVEVVAEDNQVFIKLNGARKGPFAKVNIDRVGWNSTFKIRSISPRKIDRHHEGSLSLTPLSKRLKVTNNVYIEHYVSGVVESEAGSSETLEYYKVQSVICRTYALSNLQRHAKEGFNLCDKVHCQVYKSRSRYSEDIKQATKQTKGIVIVDSDINLITASFHSNCGGSTNNSEHVWIEELDYLKGVCDTFCTDQPHASWNMTVHRCDWLDYLQEKYDYPVEDSLFLSCAVDHEPSENELQLNYLDSNILLKDIRVDWGMRSTNFSISETEDSLFVKGSGFGHGVGLCQEGAMKMTEYGHSYNDILHYYYAEVHLIHLDALEFFRAE